MPRRDGTGPTGMGAKTGRGMGLCNVDNARGLGFGLGCRGGFGRNIASTENKKDLLMEQKAILENRLNLLNKELNIVENDQ